MNATAIRRRLDGTTEPLAVLTLSANRWAVFTELFSGEGVDLDIGRQFLPGQMHTDCNGLNDSNDVIITYTLKERSAFLTR